MHMNRRMHSHTERQLENITPPPPTGGGGIMTAIICCFPTASQLGGEVNRLFIRESYLYSKLNYKPAIVILIQL